MTNLTLGKDIIWRTKSYKIVGFDPSTPHPNPQQNKAKAPYYILQSEDAVDPIYVNAEELHAEINKKSK